MELNRVGDTSGGLLVGWVARYDFDFSEPLSPRLPTHQMHPRRSPQQPQWTSSPIWKGTWVLVRAQRTDGRAIGWRVNRNVSWSAKSQLAVIPFLRSWPLGASLRVGSESRPLRPCVSRTNVGKIAGASQHQTAVSALRRGSIEEPPAMSSVSRNYSRDPQSGAGRSCRQPWPNSSRIALHATRRSDLLFCWRLQYDERAFSDQPGGDGLPVAVAFLGRPGLNSLRVLPEEQGLIECPCPSQLGSDRRKSPFWSSSAVTPSQVLISLFIVMWLSLDSHMPIMPRFSGVGRITL
jgi:hypothetical protein